ncbi:MAG TPA: hypothetical protein VH297_13100 [Gaiellaceae bacterium]|jgi:hypothetical protein
MKIGDLVLHCGRRYYLRGLDPMSVPERQAFLEDPTTGEQRTAPIDEIEPDGPEEPPPLRRV